MQEPLLQASRQLREVAAAWHAAQAQKEEANDLNFQLREERQQQEVGGQAVAREAELPLIPCATQTGVNRVQE